MKNNSSLKKQIAEWEQGLRKLINNWDLIPGSPMDEFDSLNNKLISHLTKGADKPKIFNIISSELISNYGLSPAEDEFEQFTNEIIDWWEHNR
jgi:hypothetical protein